MKIPPLTAGVLRFPAQMLATTSCGITALARPQTALEEIDVTGSTDRGANKGTGPGVTHIACRGTHYWCYCPTKKAYECCPLATLAKGCSPVVGGDDCACNT